MPKKLLVRVVSGSILLGISILFLLFFAGGIYGSIGAIILLVGGRLSILNAKKVGEYDLKNELVKYIKIPEVEGDLVVGFSADAFFRDGKIVSIKPIDTKNYVFRNPNEKDYSDHDDEMTS